MSKPTFGPQDLHAVINEIERLVQNQGWVTAEKRAHDLRSDAESLHHYAAIDQTLLCDFLTQTNKLGRAILIRKPAECDKAFSALRTYLTVLASRE